MKKAIFSMFAALLMSVSFGASAQGTLETIFRDNQGNLVSISNLRNFACVSGGYQVRHRSESAYRNAVMDSTMCQRVRNSVFYQKYYVEVSGTQIGYNSLQVANILPDGQGGANTKIVWDSGPEDGLIGKTVSNAFDSRAQ